MISLPPREFKQDEYLVSTDPSRLDKPWIHKFLAEEAYWSRGIPFEVFLESIENSLCFGLYYLEEQIDFARIISDYATFAYLADVFVIEGYRQQGLGTWLIECVVSYPELQGLRRWMLITHDAHGLYQPYGFKSIRYPEHYMEASGKEISN